MRARWRRWLWAVILLTFGTLTAFCAFLWPRERLLLGRSVRMCAISDLPQELSSFTVWTSDHQIAQNVIPIDTPLRYPASVVFMDLASGHKRSFPLKQWTWDEPCASRIPYHADISPSPDGQWALCWDGSGGGGKVTGIQLKTGRTRTWPSRGDTYHLSNLWLADSKRWLQYATADDGFVTIYNVDAPRKAIRLAFPHTALADWSQADYYLTTQDHLLIYNNNTRGPDAATNLVIYEYGVLPSVRLLRTIQIRLPAGKETEMVAFSPSGNRIAWAYSESYVSPLLIWLHRLLPRVPATPQQRLSVWVTSLDGSDPREIGHLPISSSDPGGQDNFSDLHWLPSGKRLSFVYKDSLYTTPVD